MATDKHLSENDIKTLLDTLQERFLLNMNRHEEIDWNDVQNKLEAAPDKLNSLYKMEATGGEPDVVQYLKETDEYILFDCAAESPKERRSLCYDKQAWYSRKKFKPEGNAVETAQSMGIELLDQEQYEYLQTLGQFDLKTSSWLRTPDKIRKLGGAIFGDRRFDTVFIYHNGADSYYAARGFRCYITI